MEAKNGTESRSIGPKSGGPWWVGFPPGDKALWTHDKRSQCCAFSLGVLYSVTIEES
jgi:hypothetical protein